MYLNKASKILHLWMTNKLIVMAAPQFIALIYISVSKLSRKKMKFEWEHAKYRGCIPFQNVQNKKQGHNKCGNKTSSKWFNNEQTKFNMNSEFIEFCLFKTVPKEEKMKNFEIF